MDRVGEGAADVAAVDDVVAKEQVGTDGANLARLGNAAIGKKQLLLLERDEIVETRTVLADIANLGSQRVVELVLHSEVPLLNTRGPKIRIKHFDALAREAGECVREWRKERCRE